MRRTFLVCFLGLGLFLSSVPQAIAGWHEWSQTTRNQAIVDKSYADLGKWGGQCKKWVQKVVSLASGGAVTIPGNMPDPNDYRWYSGAYVVGMITNIRNVKPGWIVQMKFKSNGVPHTFIVVGVTSSGMYVVESNYNKNEMVGLRFWTFTDFDTKVGSFYSLYYIL